MSLTFTDIFCGAGGSSIGLTGAGFELKLAANHWARAIETHELNFQNARHLCADVSNYDMRRLPRTDILWASPICTEISPAGGRKRKKAQLDLLDMQGLDEEEKPRDDSAFERTRATFWDVIRATEVHRYRAVLVENVVDVIDWELFDVWVSAMKVLGYNCQFTSVSSAHIGDETNPHAPQWRDRLYMTLTRTGIRLPDVAPKPLAWCSECAEQVRARQSWRDPDPTRRKIGKYRQQYDYRCPNRACRHALVEPYVLPAAAAIDWSNLGVKIGERHLHKLPELKPNTLRKIRLGLEMFAEPTVVTLTHGTDEDGRTFPASAAPLYARTVKVGDGLTVPPFVTVLRRNGTATGLDDALSTVSAGGNHHGLTIPPGTEGAFYVKNFGGNLDPKHAVKDVRDEPFGAVTTRDHHSLVIPYRRGAKPHRPDRPLSTVATRDAHGLVQDVAVDVNEVRYRMLQPREQLRAQRFPDSYEVTGNRGEQTMQAGNAVSSNVAQWLGQAIAKVL